MTYALTIAPLKGNASSEDLVGLAQSMFEESRFSRLGFSREGAGKLVENVLGSDTFIGIGAFDLGKLVGMCVGVCGKLLPFTDAPVAIQHYLYLSPVYRGGATAAELVASFIGEAVLRGARDITFSNGTGYQPEKVERLFQFCGLTRVGGIYTLEV